MEIREVITQHNPLTAVLDEMRMPEPDIGRLGERLFDLSAALVPTLERHVENERKKWHNATDSGRIKTGLVGEVEQYQIAFSTLASLGKPDKPTGYVFYLPDSGLSRLAFTKDELGNVAVEVTYNSMPEVKEKFQGLFGGTDQLKLAVPPAPSAPPGLIQRLGKFWKR